MATPLMALTSMKEILGPLVSWITEMLSETSKEQVMKSPLFAWLSKDDDVIYESLMADLEAMDGGKEASASLEAWLKKGTTGRVYLFKKFVSSHVSRERRMDILIRYARKTDAERDQSFAIALENAPFVMALKVFLGDKWHDFVEILKDLATKEDIDGKLRRKIFRLIDNKADEFASRLEAKYNLSDTTSEEEDESGLSKIIKSRLALRKMSWSEAWNSSQLTFWKKIFITIL